MTSAKLTWFGHTKKSELLWAEPLILRCHFIWDEKWSHPKISKGNPSPPRSSLKTRSHKFHFALWLIHTRCPKEFFNKFLVIDLYAMMIYVVLCLSRLVNNFHSAKNWWINIYWRCNNGSTRPISNFELSSSQNGVK